MLRIVAPYTIKLFKVVAIISRSFVTFSHCHPSLMFASKPNEASCGTGGKLWPKNLGLGKGLFEVLDKKVFDKAASRRKRSTTTSIVLVE